MLKTIVTIVVALAATALAHPGGCTPATYACATNPTTGAQGWQICDVTSTWVYGGDCPPKTTCQFNTINNSPYCI